MVVSSSSATFLYGSKAGSSSVSRSTMLASAWHPWQLSDDQSKLTSDRFSENAAFVTDTISEPFHGECALLCDVDGGLV